MEMETSNSSKLSPQGKTMNGIPNSDAESHDTVPYSSSDDEYQHEGSIHATYQNGENRKDKEGICKHLKNLNLTDIKRRFRDEAIQKLLKKQEIVCDKCSRGMPYVWICLESFCSFLGCGRNENGHALEHFKLKNPNSENPSHCLCLNLSSKMLWCYSCDMEPLYGDADFSPQMIRDIIFPRKESDMDIDKKEESYKGLCGLSNLGNTCYMNAALQSISNCTPLTTYFRKCAQNLPSSKKYPLSSSYAALMNTMWSGKYRSVGPSNLCGVICDLFPVFRGWAQQDSQELLRCVLDRLHEELKHPVDSTYQETPKNEPQSTSGENKTKSEEKKRIEYKSPISEIFEGILQSKVKCMQCKKLSITKDRFYDLSVSVAVHRRPTYNPEKRPNTGNGWWSTFASYIGLTRKNTLLDDCLYSFCSTEELSGSDRYMCEHCKTLNDGEKTLSILKLPEILCIHIKRFRHDSYFSSKISDHVLFPLQGFDASPYCVNPEKNTLYDLVAVINHRGSLSGGHYVAYAKNHKNDKWYEFDDKTVTEVTEDIVKGVEAYVLFFQKQVPLSRKQEVKQIKSLIKSKLGLETPVYISNYWYSKWESMSDPGT